MDKAALNKLVLDNVEKYGVHVWYVFGDDGSPGYSYTVGLYKTYGHPEIIIIGLGQDLSTNLINVMADDVKNGKKYNSYSLASDLLTGYICHFIDVDTENYEEYVIGATWYYKSSDFPLLQCLYPTTKGVYPWEDEWPKDEKNSQPVLGKLNNV